MKQISAAALLLMCASGWASQSGGVTSGPLTALQTLSSVPAIQQVSTTPVDVQLSFSQWQTAEGLRVYWAPNQQLPIADIRLVFDAGAAREGQAGVAAAVTSMLDEGSQFRDGQALAEALESVGAAFSAESHRDMAVVQLRSLAAAEYLQPALDTFVEMVAQPAFNAADWQRIQASMLLAKKQTTESPSGKAVTVFYNSLYDTHPYRRVPGGTSAGIAALTVEELRQFHQQFYGSKNAVLVMVGQLSREQAESIASYVSESLPASAAAPKLPTVAPLPAARYEHRDFRSAQTQVMIGGVGISRTDPDYYAVQVGNELLGGSGFGTLLMRELREKRGLTYGVSSKFTAMRAAGPFVISFATRADQAQEAVKLTQHLLREFVEGGISDADVARAKANLIQSFPRHVASNADVGAYLSTMGFYGLTDDFLNGYMARLQAVRTADVQRAMRRLILPNKLLTVTVGPTRLERAP